MNSTELCSSLICRGKFSYKCGKDLCTLNENTCNDYNKFFITNIFHAPKVLITFQIQIQTCSIREIKIDYCLKNERCVKQNKKNKFIKQKVYCTCRGKHTFKCGKYCTLDKDHCNILNLRIKYKKNLNCVDSNL